MSTKLVEARAPYQRSRLKIQLPRVIALDMYQHASPLDLDGFGGRYWRAQVDRYDSVVGSHAQAADLHGSSALPKIVRSLGRMLIR